MKLGLKVLSAGSQEGKVLPITLSQFLIGRDAQCQLRPSSPAISNRHCAIIVRDGQVFVRDFDSTNGTFVNEEQLQGEVKVKHGDKLRAGPLEFEVLIVRSKAQTKSEDKQPAPKKQKVEETVPVPPDEESDAAGEDDSIADLLLSLGDDDAPSSKLDDSDVPEGSTVMDMVVPNTGEGEEGEEGQGGDKTKYEKEKAKQEGTSSAAKSLLDKYMKRPR